MGLLAATSIGVGGMIGAGIFSVLGIAAKVAGGAAFLAFLLAGVVAALCGYSFARLGARYPSAGGPVEFLVKGFGGGIASGALNLLLWLGYVFALALYARAFGGYATSLLPDVLPNHATAMFAVGVVALFTALNFLGGETVGRAELAIVAVKVAILLLFTVAGLFFVEPTRLSPTNWGSPTNILFAAGVVFLAYEGFGLTTNAAEDMRAPRRTLPRALYLSIGITVVIYIAVTLTVVGNLAVPAIVEAEDHALAAAARPFLGQVGFTLIGVAALFSTASAINATLYGGANVSYLMAQKGGLPEIFRRKVWQQGRAGLFITAALVAGFSAFLDLESITLLGSMAFLVVYGAVSLAHLRVLDQTGANRWIVILAVVGCIASLISLVLFQLRQGWMTLALFGGGILFCAVFESLYRKVVPHVLQSRTD